MVLAILSAVNSPRLYGFGLGLALVGSVAGHIV
jgi:hypothetical protein